MGAGRALTGIGVAAGSTPAGFDFGGGAARIYFVAADQQIHELSYNPSSGWGVSAALSVPVAAGTTPVAYPLGQGGARAYFVARADAELHQLSYNTSTGWSQSVAMSSPVAAGTSPTGFSWAGCDQRIYFAAAADAAIHELSYNGPNETECLSDVEPAATGAPAGTAPITIAPKPRRGHVHVRFTISWRWLGAPHPAS